MFSFSSYCYYFILPLHPPYLPSLSIPLSPLASNPAFPFPSSLLLLFSPFLPEILVFCSLFLIFPIVFFFSPPYSCFLILLHPFSVELFHYFSTPLLILLIVFLFCSRHNLLRCIFLHVFLIFLILLLISTP
jgi:hypothetical protein